MKFIPPAKVDIHYTNFADEKTLWSEGGKVDMGTSDLKIIEKSK